MLFSLIFLLGLARASECQEWAAIGADDAANRKVPGAVAGGVIGGLAGSALGTGIAAGFSAGADTSPLFEEMTEVPDEYQRCYTLGYRKTLRQKRVKAAVLGGIPGTFIWVAVLFI